VTLLVPSTPWSSGVSPSSLSESDRARVQRNGLIDDDSLTILVHKVASQDANSRVRFYWVVFSGEMQGVQVFPACEGDAEFYVECPHGRRFNSDEVRCVAFVRQNDYSFAQVWVRVAASGDISNAVTGFMVIGRGRRPSLVRDALGSSSGAGSASGAGASLAPSAGSASPWGTVGAAPSTTILPPQVAPHAPVFANVFAIPNVEGSDVLTSRVPVAGALAVGNGEHAIPFTPESVPCVSLATFNPFCVSLGTEDVYQDAIMGRYYFVLLLCEGDNLTCPPHSFPTD
jgi:hypothetical protein